MLNAAKPRVFKINFEASSWLFQWCTKQAALRAV